MEDLLELLGDNRSVPGRLATSAMVIGVAMALALVLGRLLARRADDACGRDYARKIARYGATVVAVVALAVVWQAFAGRLGVVSACVEAVTEALSGIGPWLTGRTPDGGEWIRHADDDEHLEQTMRLRREIEGFVFWIERKIR